MFCVALLIACNANYVFASFCLSYDANGATQIVFFLLVFLAKVEGELTFLAKVEGDPEGKEDIAVVMRGVSGVRGKRRSERREIRRGR